ncbi:MAG: CDGSH iron-sulfur domain-containing protein [Pirellulales bacterium]|jgi:CDGSH-type Zn-finger protein
MAASPAPDEASPARTPPSTVTIRCREDGPYVIEMPANTSELGLQLRVTDHTGQAFPLADGKRAVALCRCGHSATRPFCDGSHRARGFSAVEQAPPVSD